MNGAVLANRDRMAVFVALALIFSSVDPETARIQAHLARVEQELRAADGARLSAAQRGWRARLLDELHRYWIRGRFPRNTVRPFTTPIFVDASGTRCAVAHLIDASGHGDIVARVAASRNTAYLAELADDRELVVWLEEHGLTPAEAARIQPSYPRDPLGPGELCRYDDACQSNLCSEVDERFAYCTEECAADSCPVGRSGVQMFCDETHPVHLCRYPSPAPGQIGWPCGEDPDSCLDACLTDDEVPTCTYRCANVADCPEGHECRSRDDTGGDAVCTERQDDGRCALAGGRATAGPALVLLLLALRARRPGRAR